jgi:prepilin-type N-terminal cleavage/methylation domain-containing protein
VSRVIVRIRRRISIAREDDRGISMIELIVAMAILLIIITLVVGAYSSTVRSLGVSNSLNKNSEQASNGMNESAREIRAATSNPVVNAANDPAVVAATNESVTIYAYVNLQSASVQQPEMVRLRVDSTTRAFKEDIWPATQNAAGYWIFPSPTTTPTNTRILCTYVTPYSGSGPYTFTYLAGTTPLVVPTTGTFTTAQLNSITSIQLTLTVQTNLTNANQSVTLQNTIGMPNLNQ